MNLKGCRVAFETLGCKLNFSETSSIRRGLEEYGAITVAKNEQPDLIVVNTCSVTDMAEKKARQMLRHLHKKSPAAHIAVVGCYAQLRSEELQAMDGVVCVVGAKDKMQLRERLLELELPTKESHSCDIFSVKGFQGAYSFGDRTRSFLKIQDGCNYFCSYCTIPYARGVSRSATIEQVVMDVEQLAANGVKEIILTGVNTGEFGKANGESLLELMRVLDSRNDIERYRISSIEPNLLTDEIIQFIAESKHFMPHFHIPLQAGSDEVLKLMRRRYDTALFAEKVATIRRYLPLAFIGVDIIAGMRGETDELFEKSLEFVKGLDISKLHVFPYSERSGTKA
jgi:threonylcarbamoyladenosine tRNA methylthiotransferase MtaB